MEILEQRVPLGSILPSSDKSYDEKQFLGSYADLGSQENQDCGACSGCDTSGCSNCSH